jgi:hypothetical protein
MDFMFALAVPIAIAGESVASRVSTSIMAGMCDHSHAARLVCGLVARSVDDYGDVLIRLLLMSNRKVCRVLHPASCACCMSFHTQYLSRALFCNYFLQAHSQQQRADAVAEARGA